MSTKKNKSNNLKKLSAAELKKKADDKAKELKDLRKQIHAAEKAEKQAAEQAEHDKFVSEAVSVWEMVSDQDYHLTITHNNQPVTMKSFLEESLINYKKFKESKMKENS